MKNKLLLHLMSISVAFLVITSFSNTLALPNGQGVQNYNPGVGVNDFVKIKGFFFHAIFDFGDAILPAGTWLTIGFGVTSGAFPADTDVDELLQGNIDFVEDGEWTIFFDGIDLSYEVSHAGFFEDYGVFYYDDEFGDPVVEVVLRYAYYIVPQSIGCYDYFGSVLGDGFYLERSNIICWLPRNMI